jgi:hypothetical protein
LGRAVRFLGIADPAPVQSVGTTRDGPRG